MEFDNSLCLIDSAESPITILSSPSSEPNNDLIDFDWYLEDVQDSQQDTPAQDQFMFTATQCPSQLSTPFQDADASVPEERDQLQPQQYSIMLLSPASDHATTPEDESLSDDDASYHERSSTLPYSPTSPSFTEPNTPSVDSDHSLKHVMDAFCKLRVPSAKSEELWYFVLDHLEAYPDQINRKDQQFCFVNDTFNAFFAHMPIREYWHPVVIYRLLLILDPSDLGQLVRDDVLLRLAHPLRAGVWPEYDRKCIFEAIERLLWVGRANPDASNNWVVLAFDATEGFRESLVIGIADEWREGRSVPPIVLEYVNFALA